MWIKKNGIEIEGNEIGKVRNEKGAARTRVSAGESGRAGTPLRAAPTPTLLMRTPQEESRKGGTLISGVYPFFHLLLLSLCPSLLSFLHNRKIKGRVCFYYEK